MATTTRKIESWLDVKATSIYGAEVYIDRFMVGEVEMMTGKIITKLVTVTVTQPSEEAGVPRIHIDFSFAADISLIGYYGNAKSDGVNAIINISESGEIDHFRVSDEDTMIRYSKNRGWSKEGWRLY